LTITPNVERNMVEMRTGGGRQKQERERADKIKGISPPHYFDTQKWEEL